MNTIPTFRRWGGCIPLIPPPLDPPLPLTETAQFLSLGRLNQLQKQETDVSCKASLRFSIRRLHSSTVSLTRTVDPSSNGLYDVLLVMYGNAYVPVWLLHLQSPCTRQCISNCILQMLRLWLLQCFGCKETRPIRARCRSCSDVVHVYEPDATIAILISTFELREFHFISWTISKKSTTMMITPNGPSMRILL